VNPDTKPKQVDSIAEGGPHAGQLTRGIYEILDATDKRACWGPPGGREGIKLRFRFTALGRKLHELDLGLGEAKQ
jgi:hypothetical protein